MVEPILKWAGGKRQLLSEITGQFPADFERYRAAWGKPGAITAMVNWYRAAARYPLPDRTDPVDPPTLVLWGTGDEFLRTPMARESVAYCRDGRAILLDDGTHWVHREHPERVADHLREGFERGDGPTP